MKTKSAVHGARPLKSKGWSKKQQLTRVQKLRLRLRPKGTFAEKAPNVF